MRYHVNVKGLLILLTFFTILHADLIHTYTFEKPTITADSAISVEGCAQTFETGNPAVPVKQVMLLLPAGEKAVSYSVTYGEASYEEVPIEIRPVAPGRILSSTDPIPTRDEYRSDIYTVDAYYPAKTRGGEFREMRKNGHRIFVTTIDPVRYNPVSGKICYYNKVSVKVETEAIREDENMYKYDPLVARHLKALIDNDRAVDELTPHRSDNDDYDYLIITKKSLTSAFEEFANFNKSRCMKTKIVAVEDILSTGSGDDDQDKIRNFIKGEYEESKITYVLLGGDVDAIPHRGFDAELLDYGTDPFHFHYIPADMYYACLDGTWKVAGSQYFGEAGSEDEGFEVYVARITVESATDVATFTNKTSKFVTSPIAESVLNIGLAGEYLWSKPQASYGDEHMDELEGTCNKNSYTTNGITSNFRIDKTLYGRINPSWERNASSMPNMIKSFEPVWISHLGHCGTDYTMGFRNHNVTKSSFPQDGVKSNYFFVYTQGCYPNAFDNCKIGSPLNNEQKSGSFGSDCVSEKLTLLETGCVAFLGNTRYGFGSTQGTDGSNQRFMRWFHHAFFDEGINSLEMMNAFSKEKNAAFWMDTNVNGGPYYGQCRWVCYQLNLLGDPALAMYSDEPGTLENPLPDTLTTDTLVFETTPFARVALLDKDSTILFTAIADESGEVSFANQECIDYLKENPKGELLVHIYADNALPFATILPVDIVETGTLNKTLLASQGFTVTKQSGSLKFSYPVEKAGRFEVILYNSLGKEVKRVRRNHTAVGVANTLIDAEGLSSGLYMCTLKGAGMQKTCKVPLTF